MKEYPPVSKYHFKAGPYRPPRVNVGAKLHDEWAGEVEVAGHTDAPIKWPAHRHLGKLLPVLTGDLVRAVVEEHEGVVAHYWGVTTYHVNEWRKALAGAKTSSDVYTNLAIKRFDPEFRRKFGYSG